MNYSDLQSGVQSELNRRDATTTQIQNWIQNGLLKIQRELRCPAMEKSLLVTIESGYNGLIIPTDTLELIRLLNSNGKRLEKDDITTVNAMAQDTGCPLKYCRQGAKWIIGYAPAIADTIQIDYYAELGDLVNPTDSNVITEIAGDMCQFAALWYAGMHFKDRRTADWLTVYENIRDSLQEQADADETSGGSVVSPAFFYPEPMDGWL